MLSSPWFCRLPNQSRASRLTAVTMPAVAEKEKSFEIVQHDLSVMHGLISGFRWISGITCPSRETSMTYFSACSPSYSTRYVPSSWSVISMSRRTSSSTLGGRNSR